MMDRKGSVALMAALMAPAMVMAMAMGIEITDWSVQNLELQRVADAAAWAGAQQYIVSSMVSGATAASIGKDATSTAADVAEMNGASFGTRSWNAGTLTTSDNQITAQIVSGIISTSNKAVKVTLTQTIPKTISLIFSSAPTVTITGVAIAETGGGGSSTQPCLTALSTSGSGVADVSLTGSATISASGCTVRSNTTITLTGTSKITANGTYAAGAISTGTSGTIIGGSFPNSGTIPDPYAGDPVLTPAFATLASNTANLADPNPTYQTISTNPGTYPTLHFGGSATVTMNPGTYYVKGAVTFDGSAKVNGSGVTIISGGTFTVGGSAHGALAAPLAGASTGVPGVLFASKAVSTTATNTQSSFQGAGVMPFTGLLYFPNGTINFQGSATNSAAGCSEVIAGNILVTGASNLGANCGGYGVKTYSAVPQSAVLVQ